MLKIDIDHLKKNHQMIHFFGLGFVQLKIDENLRLHFYHPDLLSIIDKEEVHNHRYDFLSMIMAGSLTNILFEPVDNPEGLYFIEEESCNINKKDKSNIILNCDLIKKETNTYNQGDTYICQSDQFHTIETDFAITRLYKGPIVSDFAKVIRKNNTEKICPFSKKLNQDDCWNIVSDCINKSDFLI